MNIVQVQDQLKNFSQDQLIREMQSPSGAAPQYLVLSEIMRRQKMQQDFANRQSQGAPQSTVAEDAIAAAGVPQGGIADMARALAPQTDMTQNTGVQTMYAGGPVKKMAAGDKIVRGGMVLTEQEDGTYRDEQGRVVRSVGEDILSGLATLRGLPGQFDAAVSGALRDDALARVRETMGENALSMRAGPDTSYRYPEVPAVDVSAMDRVAMALEGRSGFPTGMPAREEQAIAARNELLGGLVGRFDQQAMMEPGAGRAGIPTGASSRALPVPGPSFEGVGRNIGAASALDMANTAAALTPSPVPPRGAVVPQYEEGTVFDPGTGVPISGGGVQGEVAGPTTGSFIQDLILSDEAKRQVADINAKVAATKGEAGRTDRDQQGTAAVPTPEEIEAAQPTAPLALTTPPGGTGGTGGAGGISGAGGMSSYEQELMDMLGRREKAAEQDKWLALAQVGLNLMSSTQPTLGGALGEAGIKGVEAVRGARDQYDKDRLELLGALEQSRAARAAAAARAARGASTGIGGLKTKDYLAALKTSAEVAADRLKLVTGDMDPYSLIRQAQENNQLARASQIQSALDTAIAAQNDYMGAVAYIGGMGATPVEEDDTLIDLEGGQ